MGNTQLFVQPSAGAASLGMSAGDRLQLRITELPILAMRLCLGVAAGKDPGAHMEVTFALSLSKLQRDLCGERRRRGGETWWVAMSFFTRVGKGSLCCDSGGSLKGSFSSANCRVSL